MNNRITYRFVFTLLLLLPALPAAHAGDSAENFINKAAALNLFQIHASELADERAERDETKALAREILGAHKNAQRALASAAEAEGRAVPGAIDNEYTQKLAALKDAPASDFDAAYMSAQASAYAAVGGLYQDFIKTGEAGEIRAFAEKLYPEMHMMETRVNSQSARNVVTDGED